MRFVEDYLVYKCRKPVKKMLTFCTTKNIINVYKGDYCFELCWR